MAGEGRYGLHAEVVYFDTEDGRQTLPERLASISGADPSWGDITGKPESFPPAEHSHTVEDVTGLQAALDENPSWGDVTGKPESFPPAEHSHTVEDVTGLQAALDGKQPSGNYATTDTVDAVAGRVTALENAEPEISRSESSDLEARITALESTLQEPDPEEPA